MGKGFVINADIVENLVTLREDYQKIKNIDLKKSYSKIGLPCALGGINVEARKPQIEFMEKMQFVLTSDLHLKKKITDAFSPLTREELLNIRTLIAVALYIDSQLSSGSKLKLLIHEKLCHTKDNILEDTDKQICFKAAAIFLRQGDSLGLINKQLKPAGLSDIDEIAFEQFEKYVQHTLEKYQNMPPHNAFPFSTFGAFIGGQAGTYAAASTGIILGNLISEQPMSSRTYLSTGVGTVALLLNVSPACAAVVTPVIVNCFLNTFFKISLGHIASIAGKLIGQTVGACAGLPLDAAFYILKKACEAVKNFIYQNHTGPTGYKLSNGAFTANGMEFPFQQLPVETDDQPVIHIQIDVDEHGVAKAMIEGEMLPIELSAMAAHEDVPMLQKMYS